MSSRTNHQRLVALEQQIKVMMVVVVVVVQVLHSVVEAEAEELLQTAVIVYLTLVVAITGVVVTEVMV